ncbi:MAG TPA: metallophosphoesterase family protein [Streptosporangiaceae bacterium]
MSGPSIPRDVGHASVAPGGAAGLRLGLVADTHIPEARGQLWPQVFDAFEGCDAILHAGDIHELWLLDQLAEVAPVFAARGNGDEGFGGRVRARPDARVHDTWVLELSETVAYPASPRVGVIHDLTIPEVPPYLTVDNVTRRRFGAEPGALAVIVYGDTHVERMDLIGATLCINPGSPTYPHNLETRLGTIGFLELGAAGIRASICQLTEAGHETVAVTEIPADPPAERDPLRRPADS